MKKKYVLFLLLLLFSVCLIGCTNNNSNDKCDECLDINNETCKDYCTKCDEINSDSCKNFINNESCSDYCEECKDINNETCKSYCTECKEINSDSCKDFINKESCSDYCEECEDINNETCKNYCEECKEINSETCKNFINEESCKEFIDIKSKKVSLGIDNIDDYLSIFEGKRVGLITNPTGVNSSYVSTIDVLYEKVNLVALFAPEHGIRGNSQAGGSVGNEIDAVTNLPVYSLYSGSHKPTSSMMSNIDVLCIDIQDVGARFYTYISTMAYAMEACKEYNKTFVVFDRPNPIGGDIVDGNILDTKYSSFVGLYPICARHGMTMGELARLFNTEYGIGCNLEIVKMTNWERWMYQDDTNTPWINPSPNMPTLDTAIVYTATCYFEGLDLSEGRGTTKPFEFIGAPYIDPYAWVSKLNALKLPGVVFRPIYFTPTFEDYNGKLCGGVQVHVVDRSTFSSTKTGYAMIYTIKELYPENVSLLSYLKTLTGCEYVYKQTYDLTALYQVIDRDVESFKLIRMKYLLY